MNAEKDPLELLAELDREIHSQSYKHALFQEWDATDGLIAQLRAALTAKEQSDE